MSYRCTNAFEFAGRIYPGGEQVDDDHPILKTHSAHFAKVDEPPAAKTETASAAPGEARATTAAPAKKAPAKKAAAKTEPKKGDD